MKHIAVWLLLIVFVGCNQQHANTEAIITSNKSSKASKKMNDHKGKKIQCLNDICESCTTGSTIILCYTLSDCSGCVERGFQMLNYVQSKISDMKTAVIVNRPNIKAIESRYDYWGEVCNDDQNRLIKEFSYLYTPYILIVDNGYLRDGYFIDNQKERKDDMNYISHTLNMSKKDQ